MRRLFFLPRSTVLFYLVFMVYSYFHFKFYVSLILTIVALVVGYHSRRKYIPYRDTLKNDGEIYLCPVHGEIQSIRVNADKQHEIRIAMSIFDEKGIYLPTSGEVTYLKATRGRKIPRNSSDQSFYGSMDQVSHTDVTFTSKNQTPTQLRFIDSKYGTRPTIWLKSGDRGRGAACFGYYPFGGTLIIYLPSNSDILVFEKERVSPGMTVLAALKDTH